MNPSNPPAASSSDAAAAAAAQLLARIALALAVVLIAYGSLYPFAFKRPAAVLLGWPPRASSADVVINLLLYAPVGLLGWFAASRAIMPGLRALLVIGGAALLSTSIEIVQAFDLGRHSSALDVMMNAAGAVCGIAAALALRHAPVWARLPRHPEAGGALLLLGLWMCWRLAPFLVDVSGATLSPAFAPFLSGWRPDPAMTLAFALQWLIVIDLVAAVTRPGTELLRTLLVALVLTGLRAAMPGKIVLPQEIYGLALAAGLWAIGLRQALVLAVLLAASLVHLGLVPYGWGPSRPFNWVPFRGLIRSASEPAMQALLWRLFVAGALAWLLARTGIGYRGAVPVGLGVTLGIEWGQTGVSGRTPDITDPLIYAVMGLILARMERIARAGSETRGEERWPRTGPRAGG